jgi:hypothetical protein
VRLIFSPFGSSLFAPFWPPFLFLWFKDYRGPRRRVTMPTLTYWMSG